jgi:hypothetical protein
LFSWWSLSFWLPTNNLYAFLSSPIRVTGHENLRTRTEFKSHTASHPRRWHSS